MEMKNIFKITGTNNSTRLNLVFILVIFSFLFFKCEKDSGLPVDGDGNEYDTVVIGSQVWLAENLKTTKYNNGVSIPLITDNAQWTSMTSAAFCWYDNNPDYKEDYGALYNWYAVNSNTLCPVGWHVPTQEEWNILNTYLGDLAGAKLKDRDERLWSAENTFCGTDDYGFKARPGGVRNSTDGLFYLIMEKGLWWTSTESINEGWINRISLQYDICKLELDRRVRPYSGISIRCIKNE